MAKPTAVATTGYQKRQLSIEQLNVIDALVQGKSDREAAELCNVNRVSVTRWRLYSPEFQAQLNSRRKELWGESVDRLRALLKKALDVIETALESGEDRAKVALAILRMTGLERDLGTVGSDDPIAIIDGLARQRWSGNQTERLFRELEGREVTEAERWAVLEDLEQELGES